MKLHLGTIGDTSIRFLENQYVSPPDPLTMEQMVDKKNHNTMMIDIAYAFNYSEFDEVKDFPTTHETWNMLEKIYGGDENVRRAKVAILRYQFNQMRMREDENIIKYTERIKASVSAIRASGGEIEEETVV